MVDDTFDWEDEMADELSLDREPEKNTTKKTPKSVSAKKETTCAAKEKKIKTLGDSYGFSRSRR